VDRAVSTASAVAENEARSRSLVGLRSHRWSVGLAALMSAVLVCSAAEIVLDAASGSTPQVPLQPAIDSWLSGIGERLVDRTFLPILLITAVAYGALILIARRRSSPISKRWAIGLIVLIQLIIFVAPVLLAKDLFTNVAYANEAIHGVNPYIHGPSALPGYAGYPYVSSDWIHWATPYGPLFTLITLPAGLFSLDGGIWFLKVEALIASLATVALTWRCARQRGLDPVLAILIVGLNPLLVLYALGGSHNDLIMMALMMGGVTLSIAPAASARREAAGAGAVVAGALVKATLAVMLPFLIVSKRRVAPIVGSLAVLVLGLVIGYALFGSAGVNLIAGLNREGHLVSSYSFASQLAHLFNKAGVYPIDHRILTVALIITLIYLLWRVWRGYDWVTASGWGLLAIAVSSTWLMPWYTIWPLPLAVISRDRRLLVATFAIQAIWIIHQTSPLYGPVPTL
jgi:alpha-1,6-mannosyltransferase